MKKRKDGYYQVSKVIDGKRLYFYGKTRQIAQQKLNARINRKEDALFGDVAADWWERHSATLEYNTLKPYRPAYRRAVTEFGDSMISDIAPPAVASFINRFAVGHADKTVRTQLMVINLIFKHAINFCGISMQNPARDVVIPKRLPKKKVSAPSHEDIIRIKEYASEPFGLFPLLAAFSGLRKGELLCLDWTDVDLEKRRITVNKSLYHENNKPKVKRPKTEKGYRVVPIASAVLPYLKKGRGPVFPNQDGGYMSETQFQKAWSDYKAASGITCTCHSLRHLFATVLYEHDVSPKSAMYLLGHAQISTTYDIYAEIRESQLSKIEKKIFDIDIE